MSRGNRKEDDGLSICPPIVSEAEKVCWILAQGE